MPTASVKTKKTAKRSDLKTSHRDLAFEVLRRSIVLGDTKSGTRINERVVAEKLGISRVPVREAMLCLHGEGLLSKSKCGLEVTRVPPEDVPHQIEFRAIIECAATRLAAQRITPDEVARLQEEISRQAVLHHDEDWRAMRESDLLFHQLILRATNNPFLARLSGTLALGLVYAGYGDEQRIDVGHRAILEAISDGDGELAARHMYEHVVTCREIEIAPDVTAPLPGSGGGD